MCILGITYSLKSNNKKLLYLSTIIFITWTLHLTFAGVGWFYRYEAYLVVSSMIILAKIYNDIKLNTVQFWTLKKFSIIIIILILPLSYRLASSLYKSSYAIQNIYNQQVQMATYISKKGYKSVILNDIGAVCYYNDIQTIDVLGLGTNEIVDAIKNKKFNQQFLINLSKKKKSDAAFLYKNILNFDLPQNWQLIDSIKIKNNVVCWDNVVYVYSVKP